jgi:hypothetical protein
MRSLVPCPSCHRHVESPETACPFCQEPLTPAPSAGVCQGPCSGHSMPRLGRAALMAAGAALLCAACQSSVVAAYGVAIIPDAGGQTADAAGQTADAPTGDAAK